MVPTSARHIPTTDTTWKLKALLGVALVRLGFRPLVVDADMIVLGDVWSAVWSLCAMNQAPQCEPLRYESGPRCGPR